MSAQRVAGFSGAEPIRFADMLAWSVLTQQPLASYETRLIVEIDNIFMREMAKKRDADSRRKAKGKRNW